MNKKGLIRTIAWLLNPRILIIIAILAIIYFGFFYTGSIIDDARNCNLGSWGIQSYDSVSGELIIPVSGANARSAGDCLGVYAITSSDKGYTGINNKADCVEIGFAWDDNEKVCRLTLNWYDGKTYTSTAKCYQTCTDPRGCGGFGLAYQQSSEVGGVSFDGFRITFPISNNAWTPVSCHSGNIIVKVKKEQKVEEPIFSILPEDVVIDTTENTITKVLECQANIDCIKTCGDLTPTCISGKCYCDAKRTENEEKITVVQKMTIFDKISYAIQRFIDKILGVFK